MYKDIFVDLGLTDNQSIIYEYLLKNGDNTAGNIIKNTPLKRGLVYNILDELCELKLINKRNNRNKVAVFSPEHPEKLREYLNNKEKDVIKAKNTLESNFSSIISDFNLISNKPGVRVFEGEAGIRKVAADMLTSKTTIYTYLDMDNISKFIDKLDQEFYAERKKKKIKQNILVVNSKIAKEKTKSPEDELTQVKYIKINHFKSAAEIYDGKIAFVTLSDDEKNKIGIIIEDKNIYEMQKSLFESYWEIV